MNKKQIGKMWNDIRFCNFYMSSTKQFIFMLKKMLDLSIKLFNSCWIDMPLFLPLVFGITIYIRNEKKNIYLQNHDSLIWFLFSCSTHEITRCKYQQLIHSNQLHDSIELIDLFIELFFPNFLKKFKIRYFVVCNVCVCMQAFTIETSHLYRF